MRVEEAKTVLDWLAAYRESKGDKAPLETTAFAKWLAEQGGDTGGAPVNANWDGLISMHFGFIANYATFYARRLFRESAIYSMTDWAFLATLQQVGAMKKSALIQHNILEKSSGTEVLKRLLKQGFIEEQPDPDDRRAKQVRLTEAGVAAVNEANAKVFPMGKVVTGDLTPAEKQTLLGLLQKLHRFHEPIFKDYSEEELAALLGGDR
jgi:DNA-binding MarR family transcriptional regulator